MKIAPVDYTTFWSLVTSKALMPQYIQGGDQYAVFALEGNVSWETTVAIDGGANQTDFEANHKANCNKPLEIKAGAGRPIRVAASPQPINTTQHFKGYQFAVPASTTTSTFTVSFPSDVYIRGGHLYIDSINTIDSASVLSCDAYYTAYDVNVVPGILDGVRLISGMKLDFLSAESMYLPSEYEFIFTITCGAGQTTAFNVNILVEYFL